MANFTVVINRTSCCFLVAGVTVITIAGENTTNAVMHETVNAYFIVFLGYFRLRI